MRETFVGGAPVFGKQKSWVKNPDAESPWTPPTNI